MIAWVGSALQICSERQERGHTIEKGKSIKQPMCAFRTWATKENGARSLRYGKANIALASFCAAPQQRQTNERTEKNIHKVGLGLGFSDSKHAMHTVTHSKMTKMPQLSGIDSFLFEIFSVVCCCFIFCLLSTEPCLELKIAIDYLSHYHCFVTKQSRCSRKKSAISVHCTSRSCEWLIDLINRIVSWLGKRNVLFLFEWKKFLTNLSIQK